MMFLENTNIRLKQLRLQLKLSQEDFGSKVGVTKASISRLESGVNNITERMVKSICLEFNVNYFWLRDGVGDMFNELNSLIRKDAAQAYDLSDFDLKLIEKYITLDKGDKVAIERYLRSVFNE